MLDRVTFLLKLQACNWNVLLDSTLTVADNLSPVVRIMFIIKAFKIIFYATFLHNGTQAGLQ